MKYFVVKNHQIIENTLPKNFTFKDHTLTIPKNTQLEEPIRVSLIEDNHDAFNIVVGKNSQIKVILEVSDKQLEQNNYDLNLIAEDNSNIKYLLVSDIQSTKAVLNHTTKAHKDSNMEFIGGFVSNVLVSHLQFDLIGEGSNVKVRTLAVSSDNHSQTLDIHMVHHAPNSTAEMTNVGIANKNGSVILNGVGQIEKGMKNSSAYQTLKGIITSDTANIQVNPILIIDEFDVKAGHAATVGRLEEEALYYLRSRGLSLQAAEKLIINGMLHPIISEIDDEALRDRVVALVDSRI